MLAPLLALAFGLGAAQAQTTGAGPSVRSSQPAAVPAKKDDVARADRKFIAAAAGSGMFEVHVSQLAASKANDELVRIANEKKVELPAAPKRSLRREIDKLGKKSGDEFDRAFVREVGIQAHEKDIKLFQDARKHVKDPDLKAFVEKTLPVLQDHLAAAKKLPQAGRK
jgi:putative membrane protein